MTRLRLVGAARTDPGKVRAVNEDSFVAQPERRLWVVADGMGGHANGQWASQTVVAAVAAADLSGDFDTDALRVGGGLHAANAQIFSESQSSGKRMGSTAVALLIQDDRFAVLWAGDSRVYLLRSGLLHQLTRDHTQVQDLVDRGLLAPEDAANHPMSHVISRAVGVEATLQVDAIADDARVGDVFLLCSDGLHGVVSDSELTGVLGSVRPDLACEQLLDLALARGAPDNVTLIAVLCEQATLVSLAPMAD